METLSNMTNAATKAVWGTNDNKEEPISGVAGNTTQGEPYDAGNIEDAEKKPSVAGAHSEPNASVAAPAKSPAAPFTVDEGSKLKQDIGKPELKHLSADDVAPHDSAAGKTDTRQPGDPATDPNPKGQDVSTETGTGPTNKGDRLDGPGPQPLETLAKQHGGDAGKVRDDAPHGGLTTGDTPVSGNEVEDGPQTESHGEGTGEKYVKSTGLAADGGNFDAIKPGAGREADRLLDEKDPNAAAAKAAAGNSHKGDSSHGGSVSGTGNPSPNDGEKEKKSLGDKIKAKLHRH
ncbi:hypothetical protein C8035_v005486 [Colletotrichum spinosum]|uniref:Glycine-rich cell wall structural protein 1 n=1 Tax=Colletotrichum spinosum TaxID=1347390 RepID=A0A4R8PYQ5_9PEZI|nr:hypothetical protein C8035_v005486 [Colletotrichum spinosum]